MTTDLKRLEWTRKVAFSGARGIGRTYWAAYHTVLSLQNSPPDTWFVWIIPAHHWIDHIVPTVFRIMDELGLTGYRFVRHERHIVDPHNRRITFVVLSKEEYMREPISSHRSLRGRHGYGFVRDLGECYDAWFYSTHLKAIRQQPLENAPTFSCNPGPECIGDSGEKRCP